VVCYRKIDEWHEYKIDLPPKFSPFVMRHSPGLGFRA
jgi:hypothetical protein